MKRQIKIRARVKLNSMCNHLISGYAATVAPFAFLQAGTAFLELFPAYTRSLMRL
jgi:hypothetical protein